MEIDLASNVKAFNAFTIQGISTNTTTVGNIIDTQGFESCVFIVHTKTITDGTYTVKLEDGDDSGLSDASDVDSTLIINSLPVLTSVDDNIVVRFGCVSKKRYIRLSIVSTGVVTGALMIGATCLLGDAHTCPVADQV